MDKKAVSFLALGMLLGSLFCSVAFSWAARSNTAEAASGSGQATGTNSAALVLKLAHVLDQQHPVHVAMQYMAERLASKSGNSVRIEVFPNGQLGGETESIEQVQRGALAMVKTSAAPMESFVPDLALFGMPYLFRDEDHYWKVLDGPIGKELLAAGASAGLRGLCYYEGGSRSFYMKGEPILTPDDLAGKKIRVMRSKTAMDLITQLGGAPTPTPFGELYTALQQGMVDGAENNPPSLFTSRHFEVAKQYSLDEHTRIPDMLLISEPVWKGLSPTVQGWLLEAAAESVTFQRKLWKEKTAEALAGLEKAGVTIHRPDPKPFQEKVRPMYEQLEGTSVGALVKRVREVQ